MRVDAAIIGGTGVGELVQALPGKPLYVPTPDGLQRGRLVEIDGRTIFAMSRHSAGHKVPPHRVNYVAMACACRRLGVRACFATAAVGSLRKEWSSGTMVACSDFHDFTGRFPTLFDRTVIHTDFSLPFPARGLLIESADKIGAPVHDGGVYVCGNGPRYETPEEIRLYADQGGDVVGMTAASEAIVMREARIPYGCLAIVTNLAAGLSDEVLDHGDVSREMEKSGDVALKILLGAVALIPSP
ncbi:MAG TPA: MTAP family purine nucleoside phosphorylase [Fimbriimonadaceae bacterium]|nr:MTAP family purine nucleoside phosphorylase [Fimbriimonadaceae bacterium]